MSRWKYSRHTPYRGIFLGYIYLLLFLILELNDTSYIPTYLYRAEIAGYPVTSPFLVREVSIFDQQ